MQLFGEFPLLIIGILFSPIQSQDVNQPVKDIQILQGSSTTQLISWNCEINRSAISQFLIYYHPEFDQSSKEEMLPISNKLDSVSLINLQPNQTYLVSMLAVMSGGNVSERSNNQYFSTATKETQPLTFEIEFISEWISMQPPTSLNVKYILLILQTRDYNGRVNFNQVIKYLIDSNSVTNWIDPHNFNQGHFISIRIDSDFTIYLSLKPLILYDIVVELAESNTTTIYVNTSRHHFHYRHKSIRVSASPECLLAKDGPPYFGRYSKSKSGQNCQEFILNGTDLKKRLENMTRTHPAVSNYCRQKGPTERPRCTTALSRSRREECNVLNCDATVEISFIEVFEDLNEFKTIGDSMELLLTWKIFKFKSFQFIDFHQHDIYAMIFREKWTFKQRNPSQCKLIVSEKQSISTIFTQMKSITDHFNFCSIHLNYSFSIVNRAAIVKIGNIGKGNYELIVFVFNSNMDVQWSTDNFPEEAAINVVPGRPKTVKTIIVKYQQSNVEEHLSFNLKIWKNQIMVVSIGVLLCCLLYGTVYYMI